MTLDDLRATMNVARPPEDLPALVQALWWDAKGFPNWAHRIAEYVESDDAAWVHAYLHRKEGDASNANYWYERAGKPPSALPLDDEWEEIAQVLLAKR